MNDKIKVNLKSKTLEKINKQESSQELSKKQNENNLNDLDRLFNCQEVIQTKNPLDSLDFKKSKETIPSIASYNLGLYLFILFLFVISIFFNSYFIKNLDPFVFKIINRSIYCLSNLQTLFLEQISKPYVVTIGEYGSTLIAKEEAVNLLPKLKQINIKELSSGIIIFEIDRFGSKNKAYDFAHKLKQDGFEAVHVRYLQDK